jgi:hypothetical protein
MKMLLDLDTMKNNMTTASNALQVKKKSIIFINFYHFVFYTQEADNWTTLTSDLEALIDVKDVEKVTNRIQGLQQSLVSIWFFDHRT